jgi:NTP pyrophosphatase (non-canonical NTP hydrolase)
MTNRPYDGISLDNFADWVEDGWTRKVNTPADDLRELSVMTLGLVGEAGEVTELIKKEIRGDGPLDRTKLTLELGDVLHYLCRIAREYDISLNEILVSNIEKIEARRGKRAWEQAKVIA